MVQRGETLPAEEGALQRLYTLTGPVSGFYSDVLKIVLKKHHYNVEYARNIFFRNLFLQNGLGTTRFKLSKLYQASKKKSEAEVSKLVGLTERNGVANCFCYMSSLDINLIANIAAYLELDDFLSFTKCDKVSCKLLRYDKMWENLSRAIFPSIPPSFALPATYKSWRSLLQDCTFKTRRFVCPHCNQGPNTIVPVVYGFPTADLVRLMKDGKVFLGGDHIIPGCSVFICNRQNCKMAWSNWPYHSFPFWRSSQNDLKEGRQYGKESQQARYLYT